MNQSYTDSMALLLSDRELFLNALVRIEDKNRNLVPFSLNPIQHDMLVTSTGRDVDVKPSQIGASSYHIVDFLIDCITIPGTVSIVISYDEFITGRLLRKAQNFYNLMLQKIPTLPEQSQKSVSEKVFTFKDSKTDKVVGQSSFYIASARSFAYGRGETIHNLMADEFAYFPPGEASEFMASALQRVPLTRGTKVIILSTPNGEDNEFCEMYRSGKEGKAIGKSVFTSHFYPWYIHPEYSMDCNSDFTLPGDEIPVLKDFDEEEKVLLVRFEQIGMSEEEAHNKLRWRRYKIAEMMSARRSGETRMLFAQEYPEDDVSCFLVAGDMAYDSDVVNELARGCYDAPGHTLLTDIWEPPQSDLKYILAIDPGEGISSWSVGTIWSFGEDENGACLPKHHATLAGLYPQDKMAEMSKELAKYYNWATIAPEASLGFATHLIGYPNLYYRTDPITQRVGLDIGWLTTKSTKPYMVGQVSMMLNHIDCKDIRVISQMRNIRWQRDKSGIERPVSIGADDFHDSMAIGIVCRTALPINRGVVGVAGWDENWGLVTRTR